MKKTIDSGGGGHPLKWGRLIGRERGSEVGG